MTVNLNIEPGLEERLFARARAIGVPLERFIENVLEREASAPTANGSPLLTGGEKAKAFRAWANGFPADFAPFSPLKM